MNLNDLISDYIDGELDQKGDNLLRSLMSEDEKARSEFDDAVLVHMACKEDADAIEPPKELIRETEEKILMKFIGAQPVSTDTVYKKVYRSKAVSVFVVLFFLIGVARIHDLYVHQAPDMFAIMDDIESGLNTQMIYYIDKDMPGQADSRTVETNKANGYKRVRMNNSNHSNTMIAANNDEVRNEEAAMAENNVASADEFDEIMMRELEELPVSTNLFEDEALDIAEFESPDYTDFNEDIFDISNYGEYNAYSEAPFSVNNNMPDGNNIPMYGRYGTQPAMVLDFYNNRCKEVYVSSFAGTDLMFEGSDGVQKAVVSHFSQSIAYALTEKSRMGIEIGYSTYEYESGFDVAVPLDDDIESGSVEAIEVLSGGPVPGGSGASFTFNKLYTQDMIWGAVFYEQSIFNSSSLDLDGRIGIGTTSMESPLGYGRLFAKYQLFSGVYLTLGAEGRMSIFKFPKEFNNPDKLKSSVSLIYGFQIKL